MRNRRRADLKFGRQINTLQGKVPQGNMAHDGLGSGNPPLPSHLIKMVDRQIEKSCNPID